MDRRISKTLLIGKRLKNMNTIKGLYRSGKHSTSFGGRTLMNRFFKKASSSKLDDMLHGVDSYTRHQPLKPIKKFNPTFVRRKRTNIQGDLAEFIGLANYNDGYKYIIVLIDAFSRRVFLNKMKRKNENVTLSALKVSLKRMQPFEKDAILCWDRGTEVKNAMVKTYLNSINLKLIHPRVEKCGIVERVIMSLKRIIMQYITEKETRRYIDQLKTFENIINYRHHRMIGTTPILADQDANRDSVLEITQRRYNKSISTKKRNIKFKIGQKVRFAKANSLMHRSFDEGFSTDVCKISNIITHLPVIMYEIQELDGEPIIGSWYENELTAFNGSIFKINQTLDNRVNNGVREIFVSWLGYNNSYNSWIPESWVSTNKNDRYTRQK